MPAHRDPDAAPFQRPRKPRVSLGSFSVPLEGPHQPVHAEQ